MCSLTCIEACAVVLHQTIPTLHPLNSDGVELFEEFLKLEHSEENLHFWRACERFKKTPTSALTREAEAIFEEFISPQGPKPVSQTDMSLCRDVLCEFGIVKVHIYIHTNVLLTFKP